MMFVLIIYCYTTAIHKYFKKTARLEKEALIFAHAYGSKAADIMKNNLMNSKGKNDKKDDAKAVKAAKAD